MLAQLVEESTNYKTPTNSCSYSSALTLKELGQDLTHFRMFPVHFYRRSVVDPATHARRVFVGVMKHGQETNDKGRLVSQGNVGDDFQAFQ